MKKAQMEIMGLAIVVILISLGFLLYVRFGIDTDPEDPGRDFPDSEIAANFLNTLLETNAPDCSNIKLSTLFQDCSNNPAERGKIGCDGDEKSCDFAYKVSKDILNKSLASKNVNYLFIATNNKEQLGDEDSYIVQKIGSNCTGRRRGKIQPLPTTPPLFIALFICG